MNAPFPEPIMSTKSAPVAAPSYDDVLRQAQDEGLQGGSGLLPQGPAEGAEGVEGATRLQAPMQMPMQMPMQAAPPPVPQYVPYPQQAMQPIQPAGSKFQKVLKYKNLLLVGAIVYAMLSWVLPRLQAYAPQLFGPTASLPPLAVAALALSSGAAYRMVDDMF